MSLQINNQIYYRTGEACQISGISRGTFYRWLKEGTIDGGSVRDRNGWRLFTGKEVSQIKSEANRMTRSNKS